MSKQINDELYNKMQAEQEQYREWLLSQPPEEILNHTREYTIREDILMAMEFHDLPTEQAQVLLDSPIPLGDIFKEWDKRDTSYMEEIWETVEQRAEDVLKAQHEPPIYRQSIDYAMEHGEKDAYFASQRAFESCRSAIDKSINAHFDGMWLSNEAVSEVLNTFSVERVTLVLAYTVQQKEWDLRFSPRTRNWAKGIDTACIGMDSRQFVSGSHPTVLDGFISLFREQVLEKDKASPAHEKPPKHTKERSDDLEI